MITDVTIPARLARCEVCGYEWITILAADRIPACCQNRDCRSRLWNGKKERKAQAPKPVVIFPKPVKVRGGNEDEF